MRVSFVLLAILLVFSLPAQNSPHFWSNGGDTTVHVELLMQQMNPKEIVAQLFMFGWRGGREDILTWIQKSNLGGIKIFGWNGNNNEVLSEDISHMQSLAAGSFLQIPLLVATDQEGGWVRHVKDGTSITAGNLAIGASSIPSDAYYSAYYIGSELRELGINMNFAPTVDVYLHPESSVIGPRAFSSDPLQTAMLGLAYYKGMEDTGIIATAKHFPGHGNTSLDSHGILPIIEDDYNTIKQRDLLPYRFLIKEKIPALLIGHLAYPQISEHTEPASLSSFFMTYVLRDQMNFTGLTITDDMSMGGIRNFARDKGWSFTYMIIESIRAGSDMILLSYTPSYEGGFLESIVEAYKSDAELRVRINESARRVLSLKLNYLKRDNAPPLYPRYEKNQELGHPKGRDFFMQQATRSVVVVRKNNIPYTQDNEKLLIAGADTDCLKAGLTFYPQAKSYRVQTKRSFTVKEDASEIKRLMNRYDRLIFCLSDPQSSLILSELSEYPKQTIVLSSLTPTYLKDHPWVGTAIAVFGWGRESFNAGFALLRGDFESEAIMPLSFPFLHPVD